MILSVDLVDQISPKLVEKYAKYGQIFIYGLNVKYSCQSTDPDQPWGPPSLLYNAYWVFPGGKEQPGHAADPSPPSSAMVKKE